MPVEVPNSYNKKENNLLFGIYQQMGGDNVMPVTDAANKVENKLLYAILQKVSESIGGGGGVANNNIVLLPPGSTSYNVTEGALISHITFLNVPAPFVFKMKDAGSQATIIEDVEISNNDVIDCKKYFAINTELEFIGINENTIIRITKG